MEFDDTDACLSIFLSFVLLKNDQMLSIFCNEICWVRLWI